MKHLLIILIVLAGVVSATTYGGPVDDTYDGIIAGWHLDEDSGNLEDFVGSLDLTTSDVNYEFGTVKDILEQGINVEVLGYANITTNDLNDSDSLTYSWWTYINDTTATGYIFSTNYNATNVQGIYGQYNSNGGLYIFTHNETDSGNINEPVFTDQWIHIVWVKNDTGTDCEEYIYFNGTLVDTEACSVQATAYKPDSMFSIGNRFNDEVAQSSPVNASIDEFMIFDRALNAGEVLQIFNDSFWKVTQTPDDGTTTSSAIDFTATVNRTTVSTQAGRIFIYNETDLYYTLGSINFVSPVEDYTLGLDDFILPPGVYLWNYNIPLISTPLGSFDHQVNQTLTVTDWLDESLDTQGSCLTDKGYSMDYYAGASDDWILFDVEALGNYLSNISSDDGVNMTNVWAQNMGEFIYDDYQMLVDVRVHKNFTLYFGGHNYQKNHSTSAETPDETKTLTFTNFTRESRAYWINLDNETGEDWDFDDSTTYDIGIFCNLDAPDTLSIDPDFQRTTIFLTTKENPIFQAKVDSVVIREYQPYLQIQNFTIYQFPDAVEHEDITFVIEDYTAAFGSSYLQLRQNINNTLEIITQRQWYNGQVGPISIINNTDIQYRLYTPEETRVIVWDRVEGSDDRTVVVRRPAFTDQTSYLDGVQVGITGSYGDNSITLTWNVSIGNCSNASLTVKNYTASNIFETMEESSTEDADIGTIDIILINNNQTYYAVGVLTTSEYGTIKIDRLITPAITEERFPFYDSFALPTTILGLSKEQWYTMASVFFISVAAFTFSSAEVGIGGLIVVAVIGGAKFWGWFREMTWDLWLFLAVIAIAYAFVSGRRKME